DGFVTRVNRARSDLEAGGGAFDLQAPTDQIVQAAATARVGQRRLLLLGGAAVALLLGFVVLAAVAGRREAQATARRLDRLGARALQIGLLDGVEATAVAVLGVALGWLAGVGLGAAAATARLLYPALRLLERLARSAPTPARLAVISLARSPSRAAIVVTFLVASLALALFASAYRSTLGQGQSDEAAYAVPRDALARESLDTLVSVPAAASPSAYRRLGDVAPVLRLTGEVSGLISSQGLTLLGIPPAKIGRAHV